MLLKHTQNSCVKGPGLYSSWPHDSAPSYVLIIPKGFTHGTNPTGIATLATPLLPWLNRPYRTDMLISWNKVNVKYSMYAGSGYPSRYLGTKLVRARQQGPHLYRYPVSQFDWWSERERQQDDSELFFLGPKAKRHYDTTTRTQAIGGEYVCM